MGEQLKIGENLKNIRKSMGLSLDAVSSMTGVSKTMLSQIERSESVPTLATVSKIANGLKIRFDNLLTSPQSLYCDIKYIENISPVVDNDGKILFYCIFPFTPATGFEIFYCVLKPGCNHVSQTHKNGNTCCFSDGKCLNDMLFGSGTPIRLFPFFLGLHGIYRASSLERPMSRFFPKNRPKSCRSMMRL